MPASRTLEILMLRKDLQVLRRGAKRPKFTSLDGLFFFSLMRLSNRVVGNIVTISPKTVLAWHRKLVARKWPPCQKPLSRPSTEQEVRKLVFEMKTNNPVGELAVLSVSCANWERSLLIMSEQKLDASGWWTDSLSITASQREFFDGTRQRVNPVYPRFIQLG